MSAEDLAGEECIVCVKKFFKSGVITYACRSMWQVRSVLCLCVKTFVEGKKRVICLKKLLVGEGYIACA